MDKFSSFLDSCPGRTELMPTMADSSKTLLRISFLSLFRSAAGYVSGSAFWKTPGDSGGGDGVLELDHVRPDDEGYTGGELG